jgi:Domain of unknown function (DUF4397)
MNLPRKARLLALPLAALGLAAGLLAAAPAIASAAPSIASAPTTASAAGDGWVRCAHLSPNSPKVDVYLYSFNSKMAPMVLRGVGYGDVSEYMPFAAGYYTAAMRPAGAPAATKPVVSTSINVVAGAAYTVAGLGPASGLRLQVLQDKLTTPPGQALVRVIQASLQEHKVTVTYGSRVLARQLVFSNITGYHAISPGNQNVHVAGGSDMATQSVPLSADTIHTLVVLDNPGGGLRIDSLVDAAGSHVMPAGGAATGLGGTAPAAPGRSPLPWLLIAVSGAVLAAAGLLRLRRIRGSVARMP